MYFCTVEAYTARCLRFEKDVRDAFAGLSKSHETAMESKNFWGLPERFFDMAMLWFRGQVFLKRRICHSKVPQAGGENDNCQPFPSWSWAGWVEPIRCSTDDLPYRSRDPQEEHVRSIVKWYRLIRREEGLSSLLDNGFSVPISSTDTFERITQAHEDPDNKYETMPEEITISSERNTERHRFDLPLQTSRDLDSDAGEAEIDDVSKIAEGIIAIQASAMHRSGPKNGNVSERTILFKGSHWVHSINEEGITSIVPPEEHEKAFGKDLPMAPPYQSIDTSVSEEYLPGNRTDFTPGEEHRETLDLLSRFIAKRDFRYLYFKSSTTFFRIRPHKYEPGEVASQYGISEEYPSRYSILGYDDRVVVWVQLNTDVKDFRPNPAIHDFVIISEAQLYGEYELDMNGTLLDAATNPEGLLLHQDWRRFRFWNVLLVEWDDGVAYRLGKGRVWKFAWAFGDRPPRLEIITLG